MLGFLRPRIARAERPDYSLISREAVLLAREFDQDLPKLDPKRPYAYFLRRVEIKATYVGGRFWWVYVDGHRMSDMDAQHVVEAVKRFDLRAHHAHEATEFEKAREATCAALGENLR